MRPANNFQKSNLALSKILVMTAVLHLVQKLNKKLKSYLERF